MADAGIRIGDLRPYIADKPSNDNMSETIGRAFVSGILNNLTTGVVPGQGTNLRDLTAALKDMDEVQSRRTGRGREQVSEELLDELADLKAEIRRIKRGGGEEGGSTALMMKFLMETQSQTLKLMQENTNLTMQAVLEKLGEKVGGGDMQKWLAELGSNFLNSQMSRDPKKEYEEEMDYWAARLQGQVSKNYEQWLKEREFELRKEEAAQERALRREQWEHEERQRQRDAEARTQQLQALAQAVAGMSGGKRADDNGSADGMPPLYPYTCAACQHTWFQPTLEDKVSCPKCQAQLEVNLPEESH